MASNTNSLTAQNNIVESHRNARVEDNNAANIDSPIRGPTLSTSTSSFEALDPHDPELSKLAAKMFEKTEEYLLGELSAPLDDYKLLEDMNRCTISKYSDMRQIAESLSVSTGLLSKQFDDLVPLMQQVDEISDTVDKLEAAAYKLDAYSMALDSRVKSVINRNKTHET